jgi:hypothetical protein
MVRAFAWVVLAGSGCGFVAPASVQTDGIVDAPMVHDPDATVPALDASEIPPPVDAAIDAAVFDPADCPATYTKSIGSSRYFHNPTIQNVWAHHTACNAGLSGATHLVVLDSVAEAQAVVAFLKADLPASNRFYVGAVQDMQATEPGSNWIWVTGGPVKPRGDTGSLWGTMTNMNEVRPQPNDDDDIEAEQPSGTTDHQEQFVFLDLTLTYLADVPGTTGYRAVCECDGKPVTSIAAQHVDAVPR